MSTTLQDPIRRAAVPETARPFSRAAAVLLGSAGIVTSSFALEGYTIWDDFNGATEIDSTRWISMERSRKVEGGQLRMVQRDLGSQTSNSGQFRTSWSEALTNAAAIRQLKAKVTVNAFEVSGCATNPTDSSSVQARLVGEFFNAGPGLPTSRINNVGALIYIAQASDSQDGAGVMRVQGTVYQCTATDCNSTTDLGTVDFGTVSAGQPLVLRMDWEADKNRFNFFRDSDPVQRVTYAVSDDLAPYSAFRAIGTRAHLANCLGGARTEGFIDASFDSVFVNASALP